MTDARQSEDFDLANADSYRFWTIERMRWGDTDGLGHINNVQFARYCESARFDYLMRSFSGTGVGFNDFVMAHLDIDFRAEMHFPGDVRIGTRVKTIGRSSIHFEHGLFQDEICTATARSVVVHLDRINQASTPLPEELRARLHRAGSEA